MAKRYIFDRESVSFRGVRHSAGTVIGRVLKWVSGAVALSVVYYVMFSLFFNTDVEAQLSKENRTYRQEYARLQERQKLLSDVVGSLRIRDNEIYGSIFHGEAPEVDPAGIIADENGRQPDEYASMVESNHARLSSVVTKAADVDKIFEEIFGLLQHKDTIPPMSLPVGNLSYIMTGASTGMKYNPFYKVESRHDGLDIIAPQGDPVFATMDGIVESVVRSAKGLGNVVVLNHGNGYVTRYAHLGQVKVTNGQKVRRGALLAEVGVSGKSFAPHLHYEVVFKGQPLDPVNYFFASIRAEQYSGIAYMAEHTAQSLD